MRFKMLLVAAVALAAQAVAVPAHAAEGGTLDLVVGNVTPAMQSFVTDISDGNLLDVETYSIAMEGAGSLAGDLTGEVTCSFTGVVSDVSFSTSGQWTVSGECQGEDAPSGRHFFARLRLVFDRVVDTVKVIGDAVIETLGDVYDYAVEAIGKLIPTQGDGVNQDVDQLRLLLWIVMRCVSGCPF